MSKTAITIEPAADMARKHGKVDDADALAAILRARDDQWRRAIGEIWDKYGSHGSTRDDIYAVMDLCDSTIERAC